MIRIINTGQRASTPAAEGRVRGILGPSEAGTRVRVAVQEVDAGKTHRVAPSDQTQVAYVLEGQDARVSHVSGGEARAHALPRRAGVYLEPGEEAVVTASGTPLTLLLVAVPKHTAKPNDVDVAARLRLRGVAAPVARRRARDPRTDVLGEQGDRPLGVVGSADWPHGLRPARALAAARAPAVANGLGDSGALLFHREGHVAR